MKPVEAANYLGKSARTLAHWRRQGRGPAASKIGGTWRYQQADLDAFVEAHRFVPVVRTPRCEVKTPGTST